jgi:Transcriptional regulator PadR-like family
MPTTDTSRQGNFGLTRKENAMEIAQRIRQMSGDVLQVGQGALYPSLHKLEQNGWIQSEWAISENNCRASAAPCPKDGFEFVS